MLELSAPNIGLKRVSREVSMLLRKNNCRIIDIVGNEAGFYIIGGYCIEGKYIISIKIFHGGKLENELAAVLNYNPLLDRIFIDDLFQRKVKCPILYTSKLISQIIIHAMSLRANEIEGMLTILNLSDEMITSLRRHFFSYSILEDQISFRLTLPSIK